MPFKGGLTALALVLSFSAMPVWAQNYPAKTVNIIVSSAAGSGPDVTARVYADKLRKLGQTFVIENRTGAAGMDTILALMKAPSDGYTLAVVTSAIMATRPVMFKEPGYDPQTDFIPVAQYLKSAYVLVINNDMPVKNFKEFVEYSKANPGKLTYAVNGIGGAANLSGEMLKKRFGINMENVSYTNSPQAFLDVAAGHVPLAVADVGTSLPLIQAGKLRALVVTSATRIPALPDVPSVNEAAGVTDFEAVSWHLLIARKDTPKPIIDKLHDEMKAIMADPEVSKKIAGLGLLPHPVPSIDETRAYIKSEGTKWGSVIKDLGLAGTL